MQLAYTTYGDGYPLIILHGLFGSSENWQTLSRGWAKCYRVLALDLRNHGHSPHSAAFNYRVMSDDVAELMDRLNLPSAYVLGHSLGGKVAMQLALDAPGRVDKLVVVDIAPKPYAPQHQAIFDALFAVDLRQYRTRKAVDQALASRLPDLALRQFLLKSLERAPDGSLHWEMDLNAIYQSYAEVSRGIETQGKFVKPVLFVRGANSDYIGDGDAVPIRGLFPHSKIVTIPGAGHWVHAEARRPFARLVVAFLGT